MKRSALVRVIRGAVLVLLLVFLAAAPAAATVTVTGHVKIGDTTTPGANVVRLRFELIRCTVAGQNTPRVIGVTNFKPLFDVTTFDGTGAFSITTYGNDVITCDQAGNSRWRVYQIFSDGTSQFNVYQFTDGVPANLDQLAADTSAATAYVPSAVLTNPAGDQNVTQPAGTKFGVVNGIVDHTAAGATRTVKSGTLAQRPATCQPLVDLYNQSDSSPLGAGLFRCGADGASWDPLKDLRGDNAIAESAPFSALIGAMNMGQSAGLQVIGDSTGNDTDEWVYLTGVWLASKFPAYTVKDYVWNDSTQDYDAALSIQSGSGGERYVSFAAGVNGARIPDDDITLTSGDVDVRCKLAPDTWRPAAVYFCFRKYSSPYRVIRLGLQTTGKISFEWSSTGSDSFFTQSTVAATDFGANNAQWIRATFQPGTSAVNFYTSADNVTYTQVGTQVTTSAGSLFVGGNGIYDTFIDDWTIGGNSFNGKIFKVELHQGINGPIVSPRNIDAFQGFDSNATFGGAPELNIVNASMPGAALSYFTDTTRQKTLMTNYSQESVIFSLSHNETRNLGKTEMVQYASLLTTVKSKYPLARVVVLTQNPRLPIAGFVREQAVRRQQIMSWAVQNGYAVIDTFKAFYNDPRGLTTLINNSDGIHPTGAGKQLWADQIETAMKKSLY